MIQKAKCQSRGRKQSGEGGRRKPHTWFQMRPLGGRVGVCADDGASQALQSTAVSNQQQAHLPLMVKESQCKDSKQPRLTPPHPTRVASLGAQRARADGALRVLPVTRWRRRHTVCSRPPQSCSPAPMASPGTWNQGPGAKPAFHKRLPPGTRQGLGSEAEGQITGLNML